MRFDPIPVRGSARRERILAWAVSLIFAALILRLFTMQVLQGTKYRELSEENRIRVEVLTAPRGEIRDRKGRLLADNIPSFTVTLDPFDPVYQDHPALLDSTIVRLGAILGEDAAEIREKVKRERRRSFVPIRLKRNVDMKSVAVVSEHEAVLPGVDVESEPLRRYPLGPMGSHLLGYVGEISDKELDDPKYSEYLRGDLIGRMGIERQWESILRGVDGKRFVEVNALGRKAELLGDKRPILPKRGTDLTLTIDLDLQRAAELAFEPGARGAVVAIDPRNGDVLALASRPNYDPNEMATGISFKRWKELSEGNNYPLFNRAIQAAYPPGSTLKPFVVLCALAAHAIEPGTTFRETCDGVFQFGSRPFRCWNPRGHGTVAMRGAIAQSCDVYFYQLGIRLGLDRLSSFMKTLGLSQKSGIDLPQERRGLFPDAAWYDKRFGVGRWSRGLILNLAIGQGESSVTPVKLAQITAMIANGGMMWRPRLVHDATKDGTKVAIDAARADSISRRLDLNPNDLRRVQEAMEAVIYDEHGTGGLAKVEGVRIAGKTGTAQNPHGEDHALFICYAPADAPEIAIAVLLENAGHGGSEAAPVAQKVLNAFFHPAAAESARVAAEQVAAKAGLPPRRG
ncbi:MAG TPA: penicillin-binding protein 2 [Candidatus Eisenbacteria bacterium]|nr:penicillin-binding protein 2 [Candidatus Eisenbacteria bacterium]